MKCPKCGFESMVVETLPETKNGKYRRRKCKTCGITFRTLEAIDNGTSEFCDGYRIAMMKKDIGRKHGN